MPRLKTLFARRPFPLHPLLFAAFPVLNLWASNIEEDVGFRDVAWPLVISVGAAAVLTLVLTPLLRSARKAGLATTAVVFLFFAYGAIFRPIEGWTVGGVTIGRRELVLAVWVAVAIGAVFLAARARKYVPEITKGLNVIGAALVLLNAGQIGYYNFRSTEPTRGIDVPRELQNRPPLAPTVRKPDIYFFIFDTYAGEKVFREQFGFSNRPFLDFLERKGFYVANRSTANYPRTLLSLASELNMRYLDFLTPRMGENTGDTAPLKDMLQRHAVGKYLKDLDYTYVHLGSWWGPTARSPLADINIKFKGLSEVAQNILEGTALSQITGESFRKREYSRAWFNFRALEETARKVDSPKFVFAHFLVPHGPFVLDRNGRYVSLDVQSTRTRERNYLEQVMWLNKKLTEFVNRRLAVPRKQRPVIILQSDEGPYEGEPTRWSERPRLKILYRKFFNLNAMYLPGVNLKRAGLYPTISNVNTFRLLFNLYFEAGLPLLRDENFAFADLKKHLYRFIRTTPLIRNGQSQPLRATAAPP
ncbi:MAG TPA: hypothetical protein VHI54_01040 [Actinomycetota bacterium]|nr:hypothetical protein [Actinomycetota bacterium]